MKKSTITKYIISGVLFGIAVLYVASAAVLPSLGLEYRFWVDCLGKALYMIVIPLWLVGLGLWALWRRFQEKTVARWLIELLAVVASFAYLGWCWLACIMIVLSSREDRSLGGGMVVVLDSEFLGPTRYSIYESVGPAFRRKSSLNQEAVLKYLAQKYRREFVPAESEDSLLCTDAERPDITVNVRFVNGELQDDYTQSLANYYLQEGWQALGLHWEYQLIETGVNKEYFCMLLNEKADCTAFAEDAYNLVQYTLEKDSLLKKYDVCLFYSTSEFEGQHSRLRFGSYKSWDTISSKEYDTELAKVTRHIIQEYDAMRLQKLNEDMRAQKNDSGNQGSQAAGPSTDNNISTSQSSSEPTPQLTEREMAEDEYPDQCEAAEAIWEAELKDLGYEYEPSFNAKGNLLIRLGRLPADNLQSDNAESDYYLTYDRESKNGNCYLFVLSEVPEGKGLNDAYLREFYACEKGTLKVVAGNKTSWAQVGCAEYREITGE